MTKKRVAVLMGGWSAEREVSVSSGKSVVAALRELGHEVIPVDVTRNMDQLAKDLTPRPDVIFNALHGVGGEDGVIQGLLEVMAIPYTHSGVTTSSLAMNKVLSRKIFEHEGILTPPWKVVRVRDLKEEHPLPLPYVIKPLNEGSSRGVFIIRSNADLEKFHQEWTFGEKALVEQYIAGREIQVGVMGDQAMGAIEICPVDGFYDYEAKYTEGRAKHLMPAPLAPEVYQTVLDLGLKAHRALGCRGATRTDFMYDEEQNQFYLLEVNTQPGMTPLSLLPEIVAHQGITFNQLISWMLDQAQCDH